MLTFSSRGAKKLEQLSLALGGEFYQLATEGHIAFIGVDLRRDGKKRFQNGVSN